VREGHATCLGGDGYPSQYTATAKHLIPLFIDGPPQARFAWVREESDIITETWDGRTVIDRGAVARCGADEWLLLEAWDES
jgi:hypothetical protein